MLPKGPDRHPGKANAARRDHQNLPHGRTRMLPDGGIQRIW